MKTKTKKKRQTPAAKPNPNVVIAVLVGVTLTISGYLLLHTGAAGFFASTEPETGTISGNATLVSDSTAYNGKAIKFNAPTTTPPPTTPPPSPPPTTGDPCGSSPALPSSRPSASNTGGTGGASSGSITVTTAGKVIENMTINGDIVVKATNVIIRNNSIKGSVVISSGGTGTKILHNTIYTSGGGYKGIDGTNNTFICANNIYGWENGITTNQGNGTIIQANYIHGLKGDSSGPHYDCIEIYSGSGYKVWGNNLLVNDINGNWLDDTAALNIATDFGAINDVDANNNWWGGGSSTLNLDDKGPNITNLTVRNNRWIRSSHGAVRAGELATVWTNNVWDDNGAPIGR